MGKMVELVKMLEEGSMERMQFMIHHGFKLQLENRSRGCVRTLKDFELVWNKLPLDMKLEKCATKEIPPNNSNIGFAIATTAVTTAVVAVSTLIPEAGAGIASVGLVVGGAVIKRVFGRNTKAKLELIRSSLPGARGTPPGRRGQGGCGRFGGDVYVIESGEVPLTWSGASGRIGGPGCTGQPSRDGKDSVTIKGTVRLEYDPSGRRFGAPRITTTGKPVRGPRQQFELGFTPGDPLAPTKNPLLPIDAAEHCNEALARFIQAFPHCNFEDLAMDQ